MRYLYILSGVIILSFPNLLAFAQADGAIHTALTDSTRLDSISGGREDQHALADLKARAFEKVYKRYEILEKQNALTTRMRKIYIAAKLREANLSKNTALINLLPRQKLAAAEKILRPLTEQYPNDVEGIYLTGIYHLLKKEYAEAESALLQAAQADSLFETYTFSHPYYELSEIYRLQNKTREALTAYEKGVLATTTSADTWPLIDLAMQSIKLGYSRNAIEAFYAGLKNLTDSVKLDSLYRDAEVIANKNESEAWTGLMSVEAKRDFIRKFWISRDPDLTDTLNQRLIEHYQRLFYAKEHYGIAKRPWYDDRGKIYIRLGKPDFIHTGWPHEAPGGESQAGVRIYDNESWYYYQDNLYFDFVNASGQFELRPLSYAVAPGHVSNQTNLDAVLYAVYEERQQHHPIYSQLMASMNRHLWGTRQPNPAAFEMDINSEFNQTLLNSEKQKFDLKQVSPHLPMSCNFASFKDQTQSRLDVYYLVPFKELDFPLTQKT